MVGEFAGRGEGLAMGLEANFNYLDDLVTTWPLGTDPKNEGDNHIAGTKSAVRGNISGDGTATRLLVANAEKARVDAEGFLLASGAIRFGSESTITSSPSDLSIAVAGSATPGLVVSANIASFTAASNASVSAIDASGEALTLRKLQSSDAILRSEGQARRLAGEVTATGGVTEVLWDGGPGIGLSGYYGGALRHSAVIAGLDVKATGVGNPRVIVTDEGANQAELVKFESSYVSLRNLQPAQAARVEVRDTADSATVSILRGDEAATEIYGGAGRRILSTGTGTDVEAGSDYFLRLALDSAWNFRQSGSGAAAELVLRSEAGNKVFRIDEATASTPAATFVPGGVQTLFDDTGASALIVAPESERLTVNSSAQVRDSRDLIRPVGFNVMPNQNIADATIDGARAGNFQNMNSSVERTITLGDLVTGQTTVIGVSTAGFANIVPAVGKTLLWLSGSGVVSGPRVLASGGVATVYARTTSEYFIWGAGLS